MRLTTSMKPGNTRSWGCFAGKLEQVGDGTEDCDGMMWYSSAKETAHMVKWVSPACCEFSGNEVQLFVTASKKEEDYLRKQQALKTGEQSACDCSDSALPPSLQLRILLHSGSSGASGWVQLKALSFYRSITCCT